MNTKTESLIEPPTNLKIKHPDYHGSRDEIVRLSTEARFERRIKLAKCCGAVPKMMFRSDTEFFVKCSICQKRTKYYKHLYEAKQVWNAAMKEGAYGNR